MSNVIRRFRHWYCRNFIWGMGLFGFMMMFGFPAFSSVGLLLMLAESLRSWVYLVVIPWGVFVFWLSSESPDWVKRMEGRISEEGQDVSKDWKRENS